MGVLFVSLAYAQASTKAYEGFSVFTRVERFATADRTEVTACHSDRSSEVAKILGMTNRMFNAVGESYPFSRIPPPTEFASMKDAIRAMPLFVSGLSWVEDLPVWTGEAWVGGMPFALNSFDVPDRVLTYLQDVNWFERTCGNYFYSEAEIKEMAKGWNRENHPAVQLSARRNLVESYGYDLKFDKTFYIWRIVGTNTPPYIRVRQLATADESEVTAYHSDRDTEVEKFLGNTNKIATVDRELHPFSRFPPPSDFANMKDAVKASPALISNLSEADKLKLSEIDEFPIWTGEAWVGGTLFILNGFDVDKWTRMDLLAVNHLERSAGNYFYSKEERTSKDDNFRRTQGWLYERRVELENGGFEVKFDKTFYIWRLVSTNKPVETLRGMYTQPQGE